MKRAVFLGIWLAMLLLRVGTLQGQSYTMTNGQTITTCSGTFYDPGGPNENYDDRLDYMQTFISASPDKCLKVTFSSFETESCCDKLYVYDGDTVSGTLIGTYSGTNTPFSVISTTGVLTFLFHSDYSIVKSGWEAIISCVECSLPPLVEPYYSMHYGTDTINCLSPPRPFYDPGGIDEDYSGNSHYVQTFVSSDPNRCLTVTFTDFATEMYLDKLFVYDGDSPSGIILGVYTGYLGGFSVTSVTGALTFVFDSDSSYNETGWVATVSCSDCDDLPVPTNNMHYGTDTIYCSQDPRPFYDPGGPDGDYDDHLDYVQTFVLSEPDSCLQVTFTSIDIADWNGLYVHDGTSTSGTLLGVLTGIDSNVTIVSTTGALTFHFLPYYGFGAGWEAVISCMSCPSPPLPPLPPPSNPCSPDGIRPFCTDENPYGITYASGTSGESASSFLGSSQYSCLLATPNPAWYYMQIDDPGDLLIYIQQVSATGTGLDVDFVCWGPFVASSQNDFVNKLCNGDYTLGTYTNGSHHPTNGNHQNDMGGYPGGNVIDCSYSTQSTEWCFIPNAQQGEWYLFLITNYSGQHGSITFNLVDEYSTASTNCNLLVPFSYNEPVCEGDTLVLTCENPLPGATYNWSGPGGWTAVTTDPFVNIPNVSAGHSGQYELHVTNIGDTTVLPFQLDVAIQAVPQVTVTVSADAVCEGTSVILQAGGAANYEWSPTAGTGSSITVTPGSTTTYTVIGTTGACSDTAFGQVTVFQNTTGDTSAVVCDSFDWYEHVGLTNSGNYQHTFTNAESCDSVVTLHLTVGGMSDVTISTPHSVICAGELVVLKAPQPHGGGLLYLWNTGATTATITDTPDQMTEYSVTVTDSYGCADSATLTISVCTTSVQTFYDSVCRGEPFEGYGFTLTAAETNTPGTLTLVHSDTVGPGCVSTTTLWLTVYEHSDITIDQTACDSLVWDGVTYYADTVLRDTLQNIHGCDSIVTVNLTVGSSPEVHITNPSPAAVCAGEEITLTAVTECWGLDTILYEGFDGLTGGNDSTTGSYGPGNTPLTFPLTDAFISGVKVYPAGDAIKLGNNSNTGSVTSNYLDLTQDFTVTIRAKGWIFNNNPKKTKIRVSTNPDNAQEFIVNGNSDFTDYSLAFSAAGANAQVMIETVNASGFDKRAFIDLVSITRDVPCTYQWYTAADTIGTETEVTVTPPSTGWYYFSATSPAGCERTDSMEVVVNTPVHTVLSVIECESYTWADGDGVTYTESGDYIYPHEDANGCTQVDTLHLTIYHPAHQSYTVDTCGAYKWVGATNMTYTTSDDYTYKHKDEHGCWQVDTLHLTIHNPEHQSYTIDTCGSYTWIDGETYTTSGDRTYAHQDANHCIQVDTLHLTIHSPEHQSYMADACGSYTWIDGMTYTTSGDYNYSHTDANGCTQVDTLHLTIYNPVHTAITETAYGSYTWAANGQTYTATNTYTYSHDDANGCEQVDTLHLTIYNPEHTSITAESCGSYTWTDGNGQTYTETGDYTYAHEDANNCTQVDTLHLTITGNEPTEIYATGCESYYWYDGDVALYFYNESGDYTHTFTNAAGCDSVVTLHLTILTPAYTEDTVATCMSYTWSGTTYYTSGDYDWIGTGENGCDSMATLHLTIFNPEHQSFTETAYDSYTWTAGNGNTYVQTGTYTYEHCDSNGCTQNDTLYLTIYYSSSNVISFTACDSFNWDGRILTESGLYDTTYSEHGVDSMVTLDLTVNHSTHNVVTIIACESYEWHGQIYDSSGTYTYAYTNTDSCASVDTLHLTVIPTPVVTISGPHLFCPDSSVTLTAVTETAPESYLWSNGDTTASITVSVADVYTVTAYYAGECSAESAGFHVFETEDPIVYAFLNDMVAGDTQTVIIGTLPVDTSQNGGLQYAIPQSTLTYSTITFLPDGVPCEPLGCSYTAEMVFSGFPDTAVIHSADEIRYIRLNIEHSAPVDLYIRLTCPNGNQADILRKYIDDSQSDCLGSIDGSHMGWPDGNVHSAYYSNPLIYPVSIRPWMGQQSLSSLSDDAAHPCDSAKNKPGVGWNYCWSDNTTEGYQYASANGCLVDTSNSIYYYSNGIQDLDHLNYIIMDSTHVAAGTQYYHPDESFDSLIGCPVNGPWTVEVIDGMPLDNGYIFECELGVAEHLSGTHYANVSEMDFDGLWTGFGGSDSTFVITPPEDLENDTTVAYTFTLLDENGCTFDTVIYINIYAHKHVDLYDTVNASDLPLVWVGLTFNGAGCQDTLLHTVHGADSVVTLHLSVIYHYDTAGCANEVPFLWHGQTFYSTSSVTVSQSVESGCAYIIDSLQVKVNPVYRDTLRHAMCDNEPPFQWRDDSYSATGTYYDILTAVTGCDSIYVLQLTVNPTFTRPLARAICEGDTFQFFGQPLTQEGVYTETLQTVNGCDSIIILNLTVHPTYSTPMADTICQGDTFYFFGQPLTQEGVYTETLQTIHGCDSVFTLNLTVHPTYSIPMAETICQGDTFLFFGQPLTETGVYTETLQTVHGCDSVFTLNLTVHPTYSIPMADTICQGDTFHFFSQSLTETGVYTETLQTVHGCDSVFTLSLTVHPTYSILLTDTICQGDTVHFFEQLLTETGVYTETLQTVHGCDSVYTLNLTVHPTYSIALLDTICEGDTILFFGQPLTEEGVYTETLQTIHGCDSVYTLNLTVHPTYSIPLADTICQGDTFHFFSQSLTEAGVYTETLQTVHGCDSVFTLSLTVHPTYSIPLTDTICQGDTVHFFEQSLTETGVYTETLQTVHGCDSIFILNLTVHPTYSIALMDTICEGDTILFFGQPLTEAGVYTETLQTVHGCDSVYTLTLTVHPTYSIPLMDTICQGDTFLFFGQPLTEEGVYTETLQTVHGCDSVYTLTLTVHPTYSISLTDAICQGDTFLFFGQPLTEEGVYTETLQTVHGCDSIIELTLTVNEIFHHVTDTVICESDTPYVWRGNSYSVTGTYSETLSLPTACDSIFTLNLSIHQVTFADTFATACDSFVWRGVTYHETPDFLPADTVAAGNVGECASVTVLHLTVHHSVERADTVSICEGELPYTYGGTVFESGTLSGDFVFHDATTYGCDSIVRLNLQVTQNIRTTQVPFIICKDHLPTYWNVPDTTHYIPLGTSGDTTIVDTFHFASNGCDSIVTRKLIIGTITDTTIVDTTVENLPYMLNGKVYDTTGIYYDTTMNMAGCDSIITLDLTVFYNVTDTLDSTICSNLLPFDWDGVPFLAADTQSVPLIASTGADSIVVMRLHVNESPEVSISGPPVFCADNYAELTAVSTTTTYHWSTGETTQSINANTTGVYAVTVTNEYNCSASDLLYLSQAVIVNPIASYQFPDFCAGNDYSITIGHQGTSTIVLENPVSTLSWADTVFLPDGEYCDPYGCAYQSPLTFTDFAPGSTVSSVNDILYVRLNMEHSYAGDLYIKLTCPNGQKADILKYNGTGTSNCNSSIPQSSRHWTGPNYLNASDDTYFGMAYDHSSSGNNACNPNTNNNAPGIGWNYCWSNNNNQGYTYAPGQGSLVYRSVNVHTHTNAYYTSFWSGEDHYVDIFDSSNVAAGTQFYHPDQSFQSLVGCPLNGSWTIEVMDGWSQDNGYIFGWELALAPYLVPSPYSDVTTVTVDGPWVTTVSDTSFIFSPPDTLEHDTLVAYTFHLQDQYGCGYDTTVYLNVYAQSHTVIDTNVCASFDYNGVTYTQSETITWNGVNVHGCDSTCVINLTVYPMPTTAITGLPVPCVDDTAHLAAVCADLDALLVWSTGDTAQTITVTSSGDYTVTATNAKCSYDETVTVTFSIPNESTTDLTVCDSILWNGTVYTQTGSYVKTLTNAAGCDSVATLDLTVNYSYLNHDTLYLLQNQLPYYFAPHDTTFPDGSPSEFQFSYTLPAQNDCDSVIMEKVYVYMNYSHTFDTLVCASAVPLTWHEHTFTATGTVTELHSTVHGSDSLLIYTVTVDTVSATIGNVTHINCYGESNGAATATITGGISPLTYQWTNGAGASVSSATLLNNRPAGDYKFTVTDAAGCSATDSVTINLLHGQMLPGAITGPQEFCYGETLGTVNGTAATGDDCVYQWQISGNGTSWTPATGVNNTQNYTFTDVATESFQVRRAWISGSCGTLYSDTLSVNVWPVSNDTIHDAICEGEPYQQHGFDIPATETMGQTELTSVNPLTNIHGCDSLVTLVLDIFEPQETVINAEVCEGEGYYLGGFSVSRSETVGADTLLRILNYQTVEGCDSVVRLEVTVIDTMLRIVSPTADFCEDMSAELIVETNMPDYEWSTGEQLPNITVMAPGIYSVTASQGGCSVTARYVIEPCVIELYLPNAISPSREDGLNDYFGISEYAQGTINLFEISIFNRWGEMVFHSTDKGFRWNGEYKGKIYHQTVYNYVIRYTDSAGRPFRVTGSVTVL